MRSAFVTGAAGFLGRHLTETLVEHGWAVTALCRPTDPVHLLPEQVSVHVGNLRTPPDIRAALPPQLDVVFHLAGNTSTWRRGCADQWRDNVGGTSNLVRALRVRPDVRLVATSSTSAFGNHRGVTISESTPSTVDRTGDPYGRSKHAADSVIMQAATDRGLDAVLLHPVNILGAYDVSSWSRQFIVPVAHGDLRVVPPGSATWASVRDVALAHLRAADAVGRRYVLGGVHASFLDVVREIQRQLGRPLTSRPTPAVLLQIATVITGLGSLVTGREPALTVPRLRRALGDLRVDDSLARDQLGYGHTPLADQIADAIGWLRREDLLLQRGVATAAGAAK